VELLGVHVRQCDIVRTMPNLRHLSTGIHFFLSILQCLGIDTTFQFNFQVGGSSVPARSSVAPSVSSKPAAVSSDTKEADIAYLTSMGISRSHAITGLQKWVRFSPIPLNMFRFSIFIVNNVPSEFSS
jgi:hypothetical protein